MANQDRPSGFSATGCQYGLEPVSVDASNSTAFFRGDVTMGESDGNGAPATAGSIAIIGVAHASTTATTAAKTLLAASTAGTILVSQDPAQQYIVQCVTGTSPTQTMIFNNHNHIAGTGSTVTGLSGHELDTSTAGTSDGGFVLLDYVNREDNDATVEHADAVVRLNVGEGILTLAGGV